MINEAIQTISDRLRSPLFGNFFFSWIAFNWKIVYTTIFVSESTLNGKTKLTAVLEIFNGYGPYMIYFYTFIFPLSYTLLVILFYPKIRTWAEKIRITNEFEVKKFNEFKIQELNEIQTKNIALNNENRRLNENAKNELLENIIHNKYSLEQIFIGIWKIEITQSDNSFNEFNECRIKKNVFVNNNGEIISFKEIRVDSKHSQIKILVKYNGLGYFSFDFSINERGKIQLFNSEKGVSIILKQISVR